MSKFESIGIIKQYNCKTVEEATNAMHHSCELCVTRGWRNCKFCGIAAHHEIVLNNLTMTKKNEEIERKLAETNKRLGLA